MTSPIRTDGIVAAANALRHWERRQDLAANNLANVNTDGFKAERGFARLVGEAPVIGSATDWREGPLTSTSNPLDVATRGSAFFVLATPKGERWSRGGAWQVDNEGFLADHQGHRVLGERGAIKVAGREVSIDRTGRVAVDGIWIDRLRMEEAPKGVTLQHEDGVRWVPPTERLVAEIEPRDVRQGVLEGSNVNAVESLVDLITIQRNFALSQKALTTLDDIRATISNQLGKAG